MVPKKSTLAALFFATALVSSTASAAFAGEVTGNGKDTAAPGNANSVCAFSGQNDDPTGELGHGPGGRTQSFGQDVRAGRADPQQFNPGNPLACRGN